MARRGGAWAWAATAAALLWWMAAGAGAVWLEIPPSATKCVSEEIQSNVIVIGDYSVLYEHHLNPTVTVKVCALCRGINLGVVMLFYADEWNDGNSLGGDSDPDFLGLYMFACMIGNVNGE